MSERTKLDLEIEKNFRVFKSLLGRLLAEHRDRFALLRHEELIGVYDTIRDAKITGDRFFPDGLYSIQQITDEPANLGYFSHALHLGDS